MSMFWKHCFLSVRHTQFKIYLITYKIIYFWEPNQNLKKKLTFVYIRLVIFYHLKYWVVLILGAIYRERSRNINHTHDFFLVYHTTRSIEVPLCYFLILNARKGISQYFSYEFWTQKRQKELKISLKHTWSSTR